MTLVYVSVYVNVFDSCVVQSNRSNKTPLCTSILEALLLLVPRLSGPRRPWEFGEPSLGLCNVVQLAPVMRSLMSLLGMAMTTGIFGWSILDDNWMTTGWPLGESVALGWNSLTVNPAPWSSGGPPPPVGISTTGDVHRDPVTLRSELLHFIPSQR